MTKAAHFEATTLPDELGERILARIEGGAPAHTLAVHWRDKSATLTERAPLATRLRRAGRPALSALVLRADVTAGHVLVVVDLARGVNVTLASLPKRAAPVVVAQEGALGKIEHVEAAKPDPVLVQPRRRVHVARVRAQASGRYLANLQAVTPRPGVPRGRVSP